MRRNKARQKVMQDLNSGMCTRRPMTVEVPVMLNPGEYLSVNNTSHFSSDGHLDLHLQAIVEGPASEDQHDKNTQTERFLEIGKYNSPNNEKCT